MRTEKYVHTVYLLVWDGIKRNITLIKFFIFLTSRNIEIRGGSTGGLRGLQPPYSPKHHGK